MIFELPENDIFFPNPMLIPKKEREVDGFYAIGGDLSSERLIEAYSQGIFPWTAFRDLEVKPGQKRTMWNKIRWYCPMDRFVIFPEEIHISHSMRTLLHKNEFKVTRDNDFKNVIKNCSKLRINERGAWLGPQMIEAFTKLHHKGVVHSVEVWHNDMLVGGLYGVALNGAFMGESMFSLIPNASKVALIHLCQFVQSKGGKFVDCQFETPHLKSMGGRHISYEEYLQRLYSPQTKENVWNWRTKDNK